MVDVENRCFIFFENSWNRMDLILKIADFFSSEVRVGVCV